MLEGAALAVAVDAEAAGLAETGWGGALPESLQPVKAAPIPRTSAPTCHRTRIESLLNRNGTKESRVVSILTNLQRIVMGKPPRESKPQKSRRCRWVAVRVLASRRCGALTG